MKKLVLRMSVVTMVLMMSIVCSCGSFCKKSAPEVGTLTAYYAKEDFKVGEYEEYKKGQLICDSNDPMNRIVDQDDNNYKYEGNDTGEYYSWLLPKSKVEKKTYTMNQLSPENVGDKACFVAGNGCVAKIFWSNINGHQYCSWDGKKVDYRSMCIYSECYVLSVEKVSFYDGNKYLFEEQLNEKKGYFAFYSGNSGYAGEIVDPSDINYREGQIGYLEEGWYNKEGWDSHKTAYNDDGKLLVDQWEADGIPDNISIAYIADEDALYIDGVLYYRSNNVALK